MQARVLVIACGAIARELVRIKTLNSWDHIEFQCLPADLHNAPEDIPAAVKAKIESQASHYEKIFVAYADCGTAGKLDKVLNEYGIERIPGAHCYEFYAGSETFSQLAETEPAQLIPFVFGNYKRVLYLAQTESEELQELAAKHASFLGLEYEYIFTSDQPLSLVLRPALESSSNEQKAIH